MGITKGSHYESNGEQNRIQHKKAEAKFKMPVKDITLIPIIKKD